MIERIIQKCQLKKVLKEWPKHVYNIFVDQAVNIKICVIRLCAKIYSRDINLGESTFHPQTRKLTRTNPELAAICHLALKLSPILAELGKLDICDSEMNLQ